MKTILWAALTANGNYAQSSPENPPKPEAFADFVTQAQAAGNFMVGRRTFEALLAGGGESALDGLDIVVVSKGAQAMPGVTVARSPQEALAFLERRGHRAALLSGGADLHNAFLEAGLVDEIIFVIAPVLEGKGLNLLIDQEKYTYKNVELLDCKPLGGGVIQLRYRVGR
ncbi:dihydrofolate reductase family protein [Paenibacillus mucilaginosus]|uniref:Dihydrofolate reductase-like protein n=1 Tax=Paenibacillus mucilaginosus (strain KNP414) TaxID=1036673 RepID=F8FJR1_PAEMK|nr:dihydrofolate reductase [Paenibacillus mucilaginosus]AEI43392.1 Dihydrofolate reductase-like protein [Paenibacillus mucilaginosus KNP414]MCG7212061.1 dihydrofolate reductase [Paenibacillus mucilaginosus]WDM24954.1 dihydrofolate reductase family protein [Paenibacillus mucilaginosus]